MMRELYLLDGDNHVYEALEGIERLGKAEVIVYVSQEGLQKKLSGRYGKRVKTVMVAPGKEAVDNKIKQHILNEQNKRKPCSQIYVISHDRGYLKWIEKQGLAEQKSHTIKVAPKIAHCRKIDEKR